MSSILVLLHLGRLIAKGSLEKDQKAESRCLAATPHEASPNDAEATSEVLTACGAAGIGVLPAA